MTSNVAVMVLSDDGISVARKLAIGCSADLYVHESVSDHSGAKVFSRIVELTGEIFSCYDGLVYVMPCGVVARALAANIKNKLEDPAVVVLDVRARHALSFLSGHEGGANDLAVLAANITGAEPVISTTTEAVKDIIVGVGCRKGIVKETIVDIIKLVLEKAGAEIGDVRFLCTAGIKGLEGGIREAAKELHLPLRIIPDEDIKRCIFSFEHSEFVREKTGLPAVAEPAALLGGRRTELILKRINLNGATAAVARECCG